MDFWDGQSVEIDFWDGLLSDLSYDLRLSIHPVAFAKGSPTSGQGAIKTIGLPIMVPIFRELIFGVASSKI